MYPNYEADASVSSPTCLTPRERLRVLCVCARVCVVNEERIMMKTYKRSLWDSLTSSTLAHAR